MVFVINPIISIFFVLAVMFLPVTENEKPISYFFYNNLIIFNTCNIILWTVLFCLLRTIQKDILKPIESAPKRDITVIYKAIRSVQFIEFFQVYNWFAIGLNILLAIFYIYYWISETAEAWEEMQAARIRIIESNNLVEKIQKKHKKTNKIQMNMAQKDDDVNQNYMKLNQIISILTNKLNTTSKHLELSVSLQEMQQNINRWITNLQWRDQQIIEGLHLAYKNCDEIRKMALREQVDNETFKEEIGQIMKVKHAELNLLYDNVNGRVKQYPRFKATLKYIEEENEKRLTEEAIIAQREEECLQKVLEECKTGVEKRLKYELTDDELKERLFQITSDVMKKKFQQLFRTTGTIPTDLVQNLKIQLYRKANNARHKRLGTADSSIFAPFIDTVGEVIGRVILSLEQVVDAYAIPIKIPRL